ncbi:unnamed protein product [Kuraishia capsulata CBS 1993]|uniref:Activator of Hsp90 ATPase AHSA1-like N-terminal domain-containing protein n=1 Tax=Kuraishia capsulata CBS 1993 TaxID=1382522 RepID=W6MQ99_9ASCO|nr:uncharacterized protein KUCA_T00004904001 [Kuraishia capsulata CBS 1993]CDK28919.1 unnamed protein product [Kuraishia capsulata CBS 1993]
MVVHNPNNWHWVDKNCLPWSKQYLDEKLLPVSLAQDGYDIHVVSIKSLTGDCDVTQRKGKIRCIYDMKLEFEVEYKEGDATSLFTVTIPELFHDQDEDEYIFNVSGTGDSEHRTKVTKLFVPVVRTTLMKFQPDLLASHDEQLKHSTNPN